MNDKDFVFDFYIGDDNENNGENTQSPVASNPVSETESEILLSSFTEEQPVNQENKKKNIFSRFAGWWRNRKKWQKATIIALVAVVLICSIILSVFYFGLGYNYNNITNDYGDLGVENVIDKDIVNVALFGIDTRNLTSFKGNSDSIMVLSLNTNTKKVKIISLMRDTFVPITYNGVTTYNKINSAYAKGGPELAIKVINTNFGLDITEYATVNFFGMVDIIDAVGGIEAELTAAEVASIAKNGHAINGCIEEICSGLGVSAKDNYITTAGKQHLNGIQAVAYSRIRYVANIWGTNNDYGRTDRQRYVMEQLFNKALSIEKSQYMKLAKSLIPCTETSLSYSEIIGLAFDMLLESPSFEQARIPCDEMVMTQPKTSAGSVVYYDLDFAEKLIHAFIYDDITFDEYIATNGVEKNDWYSEATSTRHPSSNTSSNSNTASNSTSKSSNNKTNEATLNSSGKDGTSSDKGSSKNETTSGATSDSGEDNTSTELEGTTDKDKENTSSGAESDSNNSSGNEDTESNGEGSNGNQTGSSDENTNSTDDSSSTDSNHTSNTNPSTSSNESNTSTGSNTSTPTDSSSSGTTGNSGSDTSGTGNGTN